MAAAATAEIIRPLRRVEYDRLAKLGAFEDERIELLDGEMVTMSPIGTRHDAAVQELNELLVLALHGRATVRCKSSFAAPGIASLRTLGPPSTSATKTSGTT